jgi:hypothetical protein
MAEFYQITWSIVPLKALEIRRNIIEKRREIPVTPHSRPFLTIQVLYFLSTLWKKPRIPETNEESHTCWCKYFRHGICSFDGS